MNNKSIKRSPLFYVGDKYKIMDQIKPLFPKKVKSFYEPFTGGGTVFLNISANKYYLNDIDHNLQEIHKYLISSSKNTKKFYNDVQRIIKKYNLSRSYERDIIPIELKNKYKKTYFAKYNKDGYYSLRKKYNESKKKNPLILYILLIYGFNRMLRFNKNGEFNLPVGNVDFNKNVTNALNSYFNNVKNKEIGVSSKGFEKFMKEFLYEKDDFVYLDPPYLITFSEYNKLWNIDSEKALLNLIDKLNENNVKFALSNVTHYHEKKNNLLINWMKKYNINEIKSNYINYHDNSAKKIREILVTNY